MCVCACVSKSTLTLYCIFNFHFAPAAARTADKKRFVKIFNFFGSLFCLLQEISNYDDEELRSLLEEAVSYKRPKDRENKSEMFKVSDSRPKSFPISLN